MSFREDFDKIVFDLVDLSETEEQNRKEDWPAFDTAIDYDLIRKEYYIRKKIDDLYNHYERKFDDHDFINCFCLKQKHECGHCHKSFLIWILADQKPSYLTELHYEEPLKRMYANRTQYACMYCGRPFEIINGVVLRIEVNPHELEGFRRE